MSARRLAPILIAATAVLALPSCIHPHHHHGHPGGAVTIAGNGPPPHAPAHGYRRHHPQHDVTLVFDSGLGVYAVVGLPDVYFHAEHFYRLARGSWEVSVRLDGGWEPVRREALPKGLAKKLARGGGHGGKKGHPPAKIRD